MRVVVAGAAGRMGQLVVAELVAAGDVILATFERKNPPVAVEGCEVAIDFSSPEGLRSLIAALPPGTALVSGTTGLGSDVHALLAERATTAPVLHAANFSPGVALLTRLLAEAAAAWPAADLEIVEHHHRNKRDAPSGTALALARAAAQARGTTLEEVAIYGRRGSTGERPAGEIGLHALRGGGVFGEHAAILATEHEVLELRHSAASRSAFAQGAVRSARWLVGRPAGLYSVGDVVAR